MRAYAHSIGVVMRRKLLAAVDNILVNLVGSEWVLSKLS